ncbi:hypothetical protein [Lentzea sp. NPDC059081]|uniref:hypothetical protein n=1 Tax=Lentzea sp. NPDC059081 TaxID=3346719 RepID=UPI0036D1A672
MAALRLRRPLTTTHIFVAPGEDRRLSPARANIHKNGRQHMKKIVSVAIATIAVGAATLTTNQAFAAAADAAPLAAHSATTFSDDCNGRAELCGRTADQMPAAATTDTRAAEPAVVDNVDSDDPAGQEPPQQTFLGAETASMRMIPAEQLSENSNSAADCNCGSTCGCKPRVGIIGQSEPESASARRVDA